MIDIGAIQRAHPEWRITDAIAAPNGGIWALGADGGVFSLNATGGTGGTVAPFFGAYTQLAPEHRQGNRSFVKIQSDPNTGGYTLVSNQPGQTYTFKGDKPIDQKVDTSAQPISTGLDFKDADLQALERDLNSLGLGNLVDKAWAYYKDPQGGAADPTATLRWLEDSPEYAEHFPGLKDLRTQGRAWTPAQWNTYYNKLQEEAVTFGLPPGMIDRADVGKMITGNVSINEGLGRIQAAGQSVHNADPTVIEQMRRLGFTDGDLTAFYLDPDRAAPLMERKAMEEQGRIAAAAQRTGYDPAMGLGTLQGLQKLGVDEAEAEAGFGNLSRTHALFSNNIGEEGEITRDEQLSATFANDVAAQTEIDTRRSRRAANFQGGGGAGSGGAGKTGLG